jgi:hypothetical protein
MLAQTNTLNPAHVNAAAAKRILGLPQSRRIEFAYIGTDIVVIKDLKTGEERFITRTAFATEFTRYRQEGAKECIATPHKRGPWGEMFAVAGQRGDVYYVEASASESTLSCTCEDWAKHTAICKHGWAVLNLIGASSLETYFEARKKVTFIPEYRQRAQTIRGVSIE